MGPLGCYKGLRPSTKRKDGKRRFRPADLFTPGLILVMLLVRMQLK